MAPSHLSVSRVSLVSVLTFSLQACCLPGSSKPAEQSPSAAAEGSTLQTSIASTLTTLLTSPVAAQEASPVADTTAESTTTASSSTATGTLAPVSSGAAEIQTTTTSPTGSTTAQAQTASPVANNGGSPAAAQPSAAANSNQCAATSFDQSGATDFLQSFLQSNGTTDWLVHMQSELGGPNSGDTLDCKELPTNSCPPPTTACTSFDHPEFFFIQKSASNANSFFDAAREAMQDNAIIAGLDVDKTVADFLAPEVGPADKSTFLKLSTILGLGAGVAAAVPGLDAVGAGLAIIGAIFGIQDSFEQDPPESDAAADIETFVTSFLASTFTNSTSTVLDFNNALFGGDSTFDLTQITAILPSINGASFSQDLAAGAADTQLNPIAQFFAPGLFDAEQNTDIVKTALTNGVQLIKQQMVGLVIESQGFFIWIDSNIKTLQDCANAGSGGPGGGGAGRFLNNVDCARLVQTDGGPTDAATQDPPPQLIGQMDDGTSGYNIDPADFFGNAIACNGGSSESLGGALESNFPHCFFSVPVVRGAGDPCESPACIIENNPADGLVEVVCPGGYPPGLQTICQAKTDRNYEFPA